jgi:hypothetical protein
VSVRRMHKVDETLDEVWPVDPPICEILTTYLTSWISYSSLDWVVFLVFCPVVLLSFDFVVPT